MAPNFIERIQAKIELFRLEQRYTRRRNRRSTFVSNAVYVNGEYIYQTPNVTGSSSDSSSSDPRIDASHQEEPAPVTAATPQPKKRLSRFSSMPGFGSSGNKQQQQSQRDWP
jgi:hypothetical protein